MLKRVFWIVIVLTMVMITEVRADTTWRDVCDEWLEYDSYADVNYDGIVNFLDFAESTEARKMANVYLKRSKVSNAYWHAFIPADSDGEYYSQIDLGPPNHDYDGNGPYLTILGMSYGKLLDSKEAAFANPDGSLNEVDMTYTNAWSLYNNVPYSKGEYFMVRPVSANEAFVEYTPPSTHDQIHVLVAPNAFFGAAVSDLEVSWDDDSTDDLILTDYGTTGPVQEIIIMAGGANAAGRTLKLKAASGKRIQIISVRSWNTNTVGNMSVDTDDTLLLREMGSGAAGLVHFYESSEASISPHSLVLTDNVALGRALEWASAWDSGGADHDVSGGNNHMVVGASNNPYVMATKYAIVGPEIWADDILSGWTSNDSGTDDTSVAVANVMTDSTASWAVDELIGMVIDNTTDGTSAVIIDNDATTVTVASGIIWDSGDAYIIRWPLGKVFSSDKIILRSDGTLTGATSGTAPDCEWIYQIDRTGLTVTAIVNWNSDINLEVDLQHSIMLPFSLEYFALASLRFPLDSTAFEPASGVDTTFSNKGSSCEILCPTPNFITKLTSFSPVDSWRYQDLAADNKLYTLITGSAGGWPGPVAGDVMVFGGKYEVRRRASNGTEEWLEIVPNDKTWRSDNGFKFTP